MNGPSRSRGKEGCNRVPANVAECDSFSRGYLFLIPYGLCIALLFTRLLAPMHTNAFSGVQRRPVSVNPAASRRSVPPCVEEQSSRTSCPMREDIQARGAPPAPVKKKAKLPSPCITNVRGILVRRISLPTRPSHYEPCIGKTGFHD